MMTEYDGGRLCYFTPSVGVRVLRRAAGDITKHNTKALHAVTRLTRGSRYSLFVVDRLNGLGDQLVIEPDLNLTLQILNEISGNSTLRRRENFVTFLPNNVALIVLQFLSNRDIGNFDNAMTCHDWRSCLGSIKKY